MLVQMNITFTALLITWMISLIIQMIKGKPKYRKSKSIRVLELYRNSERKTMIASVTYNLSYFQPTSRVLLLPASMYVSALAILSVSLAAS